MLSAASELLREPQILVAQADEEHGLGGIGPIPLNAAWRREAVMGGFYVSFRIERAADQRSQVIVSGAFHFGKRGGPQPDRRLDCAVEWQPRKAV